MFAEGTNMGIKRMANSNDRYSYEELLYVRKMYFSPEALRNVNAAVVNKLLEIRNPRLFGEGHACASDGKGFPSWSQNQGLSSTSHWMRIRGLSRESASNGHPTMPEITGL
jgi:TnpA family transposase